MPDVLLPGTGRERDRATRAAASWPQTLAPNTISLSSPVWSSQYVSVNANSGALDTQIGLPSYNPNVPADRIDL